MSEIIYEIILVSVVVWPLLLAIPALHTRALWSRHLAILPAALLTVLPGDTSLELPWLLFGTGLTVDGDVRWMLLMSVAVWLTTATVMKSSRHDPAHDRTTPLFLLTLAGNLGVILATDLPGFFSFATLMGYGFYGLLIQGGGEAVRRAGRRYLIFMILADLALFETLLLAASTTVDFRFEAVRQSMAGTSSSQFYLCMALAAFTLKAGIWPAHLWLTSTFNSATRSTSILLCGVPVAMGLLGAVRWLPLGEQPFYVLGTFIQMAGVAAMLYAALRFYSYTSVKMLPAWLTVAASGLFMAALGTGLAHPAIWRQYEYLIYPFIATLGIFLAALSFATGRGQHARQQPDLALQRVEALGLWVGRRVGAFQRWVKDKLLGFQSLCHASWLLAVKQYQRILNWRQPGVFVAGWSATITMFVLLGLALAWLAG